MINYFRTRLVLFGRIFFFCIKAGTHAYHSYTVVTLQRYCVRTFFLVLLLLLLFISGHFLRIVNDEYDSFFFRLFIYSLLNFFSAPTYGFLLVFALWETVAHPGGANYPAARETLCV